MASSVATSTAAMQSMIDLNNQAVVLIQNGYYKMSATILRSALASGQQQQQEEEEKHCNDDEGKEHNDHHNMDGEATTTDNDTDTIRRSRSSRSETTKRNKTTSQSETTFSDKKKKKKKHTAQGHRGGFHRRHSLLMQKSIADDTDFVYRRPIHIPSNGQIIVERGNDNNDDDVVSNGSSGSNDSSTGNVSHDDTTIISSNDDDDDMLNNGQGLFKQHRLTESDIQCIVLFNLALSFHLAALESSIIYSDTKKQHRMLKKALKIYEMSFNFQVELGVLTLSETLAVVNNCSTIYKKLGQPDRAECFYQRMLSTIMSVVEAGDPDVKNELKDLDGFLHNICSSGLILKHIAAPAA